MFKSSFKIQLKALTKEILTDVWRNKNSIKNTKSLGIKDAESIILEFLEHREYGLGYEHLNYMISETDMQVSKLHIEKLQELEFILVQKNKR